MSISIADFDYVGFSGSRHGAPSAVVEAAGLGIPTMIWLPADIAAPGWGDRLEQVNRNWWLSLPF